MLKLKNILNESTEDQIAQCPTATQKLNVNTANRDRAIQADFIMYGPLNVEQPKTRPKQN